MRVDGGVRDGERASAARAGDAPGPDGTARAIARRQ
jgi:hypothetical protein